MQLDPLFEAYIAAQLRRRSSPLTIKAVTHALRTAQRHLDVQGITAAELTLLGCEQYFDTLLDSHATSTVRRQLAYLRAAYRYGLRHGVCGHDPTAEVKLPPLPDLQPETYENDELRAIHAAIRSERDELIFYLLAFAGLRRGELAALTWQHVDLDHWQLRLIGKGNKFRLVPLHPVLQELLRERRQRAVNELQPVVAGAGRRPLQAVTLGRHTHTLVDRAGVEINPPSHAFRRTVATVMYENGVPTRVIEKIMGWAPRQMHDRHYLRVADETMRDAILTLYHDDPITDRQRRAITPQPVAAPAATTGWLEHETKRLAALELDRPRFGGHGLIRRLSLPLY